VEVYSTALQGGPGAAGMRRPARVREDRPMLHYLQAWLPLLSVALGAGICFGIASFIIDGAEF
jgi:hypothetical protein